MAQRTNRVAGWEDDSIVAYINWNDANNTVSGARVVNNHATKIIEFVVWMAANPNVRVQVMVEPGVTEEFDAPAGVKYSPVELPPGDPRETNFGYSADVY